MSKIEAIILFVVVTTSFSIGYYAQPKSDKAIEAAFYKSMAECLAEVYDSKGEYSANIETVVNECAYFAYREATGQENMGGL